jgi:hypothetical protein
VENVFVIVPVLHVSLSLVGSNNWKVSAEYFSNLSIYRIFFLCIDIMQECGCCKGHFFLNLMESGVSTEELKTIKSGLKQIERSGRNTDCQYTCDLIGELLLPTPTSHHRRLQATLSKQANYTYGNVFDAQRYQSRPYSSEKKWNTWETNSGKKSLYL